MDQKNLNICQDCQENPATYGDGITWARCSPCQLKATQTPDLEGEKFEHKLISGLTSIIIPVYMSNYSLFHYTGNCIGSVREHTDKQKTPYEIIIVDNGSPLQPPTLQSYYADKIIKWDENKGVTKAWNSGVRVSFGEYIVLLNNDTQVFEGWLEELKKAIDEEGYDLVMAHPMYSLTEPFARAVESKKVLEGKSIFDKIGRDFSCVMFKKDLYAQVGAFDERFFNYCQDSDYFKRLDALGKKYKVVDKVAIHHISDATGLAILDTPETMNKDKATFEEKYNRKEEEVMEPQQQATDESPVVQKDERFIRSAETGDKIYFIVGDEVHWIKNPETYKALGGEFGIETQLTKEEFAKYTRGEPIDTYNVERYK